jgi:metallophosphoesterase (TIGR00282 family)
MRFLLIGDIVGRPGRKIVVQTLAALKAHEQLDLVVANGENSADGSGITPEIYRSLIRAGVDCITLGDHIYRRKEISPILESETNIVKPANYPDSAPGRCWTVVESATGIPVGVVSLMGRVYMRPVDCPFQAADRVLEQMPGHVKVRIVDFHAEATSDKQLMGRYLDGRVTAVLGTHTHVPTADQTVFPGGTAFQCDVGMTGPYESIIGRRIDRVLSATISFHPTPFQVARGDVRLCGTIVEADCETGRARDVYRIRVTTDANGSPIFERGT